MTKRILLQLLSVVFIFGISLDATAQRTEKPKKEKTIITMTTIMKIKHIFHFFFYNKQVLC
jgi:hypothetical protein